MKPATAQIIRVTLANDDTVPPSVAEHAIAILRKGPDKVLPPPPAELSERELARQLGIHVATLCDWRNGKRPHAGDFPFKWRINEAGIIRYDVVSVVHHLNSRYSGTTKPQRRHTRRQERAA